MSTSINIHEKPATKYGGRNAYRPCSPTLTTAKILDTGDPTSICRAEHHFRPIQPD